MNLYDGFISYGRADSKAFATKLHENLKAQGLNVWFDQEDIPLAVDFQEQINDGISKAHNFLFIIAPHAVNSPYCLKEIELAVKFNKRIIPLLHVEQISYETWQQRNPGKTEQDWQQFQAEGRNSSFINIHPEISRINWVYFREELDDYESSLTGLIAAIHKHQNYVQQHTQILLQALEWQKNQKQTNYLLVGEERQKAETWLKQKFVNEQLPCIPTDLHCEFICESKKNAENLLTQVFLSSSEQDEAIKDKIRNSLMRESITVWTNKTDIKTGSEFQEAINQGIEGADNFVYLISENSLKSVYCQQELRQALESNKRIIPLLLENIDLELIPSDLKKLQFIDFIKSDNEKRYNISNDRLLQELKKEPSYYENHKLLLVKARKWQGQNKNPSLLLRGYNLQYFEAWLKVAKQNQNHPPLPVQEEFINASLNKPEGYSLEVFISYSRTDSDLARKLNDALQELGKTTWFDQESIATGTDFQTEICRGIESSDNFLFIISPKSVNSPYCADEVNYACKLNKRIVTILHRPLSVEDKQKLPPALATVQWLDFNNHGGEFYANFNELIRTLDTDREHIRSHTKWSQRALEWEDKNKSADLLLRGSEFAVAQEWLKTAESENKNPLPTDLQREYIDKSQEAIEAGKKKEKRQILVLRLLLVGAFVLLVAAIGATVVAVSKTRETETALVKAQENEKKAEDEKQNAEKQAEIANTEKQNAEIAREEAKKSQKKAEKQAEIANTEKRKADEQRKIAEEEQQKAKIASSQAKISEQSAKAQAAIAEREKIKAKEQKEKAEKATNQAKISEQEAKKQLKYAQLNQAEALGISSASLLRENQQLAAFIQAIQAGKILKSQNTFDSKAINVMNVLQTVLVQESEINHLKTHKNDVYSVSISPDSKILASASADKTIKLWDIKTGKEIRTITGHSQEVKSVSFSPDGQILASSSWDKTIKLWDVKTGQEISTMTGHTLSVRSISFSPDGKTLASGSWDKTIKLWDVKTGKEISTITGHTLAVRSVNFSADGKTLASGSADDTIKLWDIETGKEIRTLKGHSDDIRSVNFSADGKTLASGGHDKTIKLWNVETGKEIRTLKGHNGDVINISFSVDSKTLASGSADKTIKLWDVETGNEIRTLKGHINSVESVSISPDGKTLASGSQDYTIKLWNLETSQEIRTLTRHNGSVYSVNISPDGKTLASGSWDKTIKLWDVKTAKEIHTLKGHDTSVYSVSISPDGKTLASASGDKTIKLWDIKTGKEIRTLEGHTDDVTSVSISPDSKTLASGSYDTTIKLWNIATGKEIRSLNVPDFSIYGISFSPDGKTLASGNQDRTVKLWNVETGKEIRTLTGHNSVIYSVSFSPDGKTLASASADQSIKLWNIGTGKEIYTFTGHNNDVRSVSISPDGKTLASGSQDNTIKLWNLKTGKEIRTLTGHNNWVYGVSFSPDGKTLVSGSSDNTIKLWNLPKLELKLGLDYLLSYNCDLILNYLQNNPNVKESDKSLCDDVGR